MAREERMRRRSIALTVLLACAACARLGYTDRVLQRVPSPDGQYVAVCQESPAFDGPGYNVRLDRPDGRLVRELYSIGDGDECSEMAWSPDARRPAAARPGAVPLHCHARCIDSAADNDACLAICPRRST